MILRRHHTRQSDADLVTLVSQGNERAFGELLQRYQNAVYGFARRFLADSQEAEDVAQETFLRLFRVSGRYRPEASLGTFLLKIARNICIDLLRKKRPELMEQLPEMANEDTPLVLLEGAIETGRLERAINNLPVNQRSALLLRHGEHLRYNQIAEVMNLTVGAVESLLVRARRTLRRHLAVPPE